MEDSEIKTDIAIIKKLLFGNGVKGLINKVEDLEDRFDKLEIYMEKNLMEAINGLRNEITGQKQHSGTQIVSMLGIFFAVALGVVGLL